MAQRDTNKQETSKGNFWGSLLYGIINKNPVTFLFYVCLSLMVINMLSLKTLTTDKKIFVLIIYLISSLWYFLEQSRHIIRIILSFFVVLSFISVSSVYIEKTYPNSMIVCFSSMLFVYFSTILISELINKKTNYLKITIWNLLFDVGISTLFISANINSKFVLFGSVVFVVFYIVLTKMTQKIKKK